MGNCLVHFSNHSTSFHWHLPSFCVATILRKDTPYERIRLYICYSGIFNFFASSVKIHTFNCDKKVFVRLMHPIQYLCYYYLVL